MTRLPRRRPGKKKTSNGWIDTKDNGHSVHHVEADGCIVNIREGLMNQTGRKVTLVEVIPNTYPDDKWTLDDETNVAVIQVIKETKEDWEG